MAAATTSLLLEATPRLLSLPPRRPVQPRGGIFLLKPPPPPPFPSRRGVAVAVAPPLRASHPDTARRVSVSPAAVEPPPKPRALLDAIKRSLLDSLAALKKPALALLLAGALLAAAGPHHGAALAASGGRVGGSAFSSRSSSPPSSYGYTAPAPRGGYSAAPFYSPSPFVSVGPAVGIGFGGSSFFFVLMGFAAFLYLAGFLSDSSGGSVLTETDKTTVLKLQVGLLGMARSFQKELDQIAEKADTSTPAGLSYVLTETTLALLRHPDCCISAYSSVDVKRSIDDGEKRFNQLSIEERGKFDEETLVNVNSIKRQKAGSQRSSGFSNEYIVITILVAAEGVHKLPSINGSGDLKTALQKLGAIPSRKILAVEVLWTPQNENDTLSERELLEDYPLLRPL
ncbi:FLUCTUATING-LIGHT-ACCLIMATION protein 1, chloroplastic [Oryza sativa Japonica Group]|uniref:Os03g0695500 protein n=5 Tax=Oryza TaxID=4527 RepID=A0A5S6R9W6_ORYSJ|nr:uncharacterized protein LOC4333802 [Oryza sativa Japonica Group]XP_052148645.1 uncharacterized protein LOC127767369 [Oryza glaberrima]EAY91497.1 hypothetical protein OsI_13131 [Oryza sativa Indica Group]KAB8093122.1 hypothetical protein EE612_019837 [Oryza sativa]AAO19365.1 unknown protein [Oryza sativa Japonica Group]ABF98341.1 expressed protein [Oryza sativa Japonica Group]KAF2940791.1 hypothetical protein DAI22_03g300800 [Oryza sativa Japonica Group]|eukprot:NP_001050975.2 Os03g0695500 [Oryza sativa Japonica Group]